MLPPIVPFSRGFVRNRAGRPSLEPKAIHQSCQGRYYQGVEVLRPGVRRSTSAIDWAFIQTLTRWCDTINLSFSCLFLDDGKSSRSATTYARHGRLGKDYGLTLIRFHRENGGNLLVNDNFGDTVDVLSRPATTEDYLRPGFDYRLSPAAAFLSISITSSAARQMTSGTVLESHSNGQCLPLATLAAGVVKVAAILTSHE